MKDRRRLSGSAGAQMAPRLRGFALVPLVRALTPKRSKSAASLTRYRSQSSRAQMPPCLLGRIAVPTVAGKNVRVGPRTKGCRRQGASWTPSVWQVVLQSTTCQLSCRQSRCPFSYVLSVHIWVLGHRRLADARVNGRRDVRHVCDKIHDG